MYDLNHTRIIRLLYVKFSLTTVALEVVNFLSTVISDGSLVGIVRIVVLPITFIVWVAHFFIWVYILSL